MAITNIGDSHALRKALWEKKLYDLIIAGTFFNRFTSESMNSIVWNKKNLMKEQGDKITFGLTTTDPSDHAGVSGSTTLEGNEVALEFGDFNVELEVYRQAVASNIKSKKRTSFNLSAEEEEFLRKWYVSKLDDLHFSAAYASTTLNCYMNGSSGFTVGSSAATGIAAVTAAAGKLTPDLISQAVVVAKTGNGGAHYRIEPINVDGKSLYVLVVSEDTMYDLRSNSVMQQANRDALERGKSNPLFRNDDLIYNGVLITACERCNSGTNASSVAYSENLLMGKSALVRADGMKFELIKEKFDYKFKNGLAAQMYTGIAKAKFDSKDFSILNIITSRTDISGS